MNSRTCVLLFGSAMMIGACLATGGAGGSGVERPQILAQYYSPPPPAIEAPSYSAPTYSPPSYSPPPAPQADPPAYETPTYTPPSYYPTTNYPATYYHG